MLKSVLKRLPTEWRTLATGFFFVVVVCFLGCSKVGTRSGSAAKALTHRAPHCRTAAEAALALTSGFRGDPSLPGTNFTLSAVARSSPVQRRGVRVTLFPALRLPGVGADLPEKTRWTAA